MNSIAKQTSLAFAFALVLGAILGVLRLPPLAATLLTVLATTAVILAASSSAVSGLRAVQDGLSRVLSNREPTVPAGGPDEVRAIFSDLVAAKREFDHMRGEQARLAATLSTQAEALHQGLVALEKGLTNQLGQAERTAGFMRAMGASHQVITEHIDRLMATTETSGSSILEMTATNDEVAENIVLLGVSVREMVASVEQMAFSIKEVAKNVDALSLTAEETSSSMNEMDVSIDQVQSNANETARLSEEVALDAERGAEAILKTIGEIYRIKESSQEAVAVISNLGSRIEAIGQILNVIDEVAEQTNLLALNAAIIAAQAGDHGKGFAVVADEIKDLAERAGASTKEIADLIKTIQAESKNAIWAVERGAQNVDRGVEVSNEAERTLKKILESSKKSTNMVRAIARATVEQAKGSRQVTDAISRIAETVGQVAAATSEQARGSELVMTNGEKMRVIAAQVERSSQEQTRGGHQISSAIESINQVIAQLNAAEREKIQNVGQALSSAEAVAKKLEEHSQEVKEMTGLTGRLRNLGS